MSADPTPYVAALSATGLPGWLQWTVEIRPRRKAVGATVEPGGSVTFPPKLLQDARR